MTAHAWTLLAGLRRRAVAARRAARPLHRRGDGRPASRSPARVEAPLYRLCGVEAGRRDGLAAVHARASCSSTASACSRYTRCSACSLAAAQSAAPGQRHAGFELNTAISFVTNTNWQGYGGETTMSYLTQMLGLAVQNFLSAATGIAVVFALIRGFARHSAEASATSGPISPASRCTCCCRCRSSSRWSSSARAWSRTSPLQGGQTLEPTTTRSPSSTPTASR